MRHPILASSLILASAVAPLAGCSAPADDARFAASSAALLAAPVIGEVMIDPPGADTDDEYVELRGEGTLPDGTWLVAIEGDAAPATIHLAVDLSGVAFGANGRLVVGSASTAWTLAPDAARLASSDFERTNGVIQNGAESILLVHTEGATPKAGDDWTSYDVAPTLLDGIGWKNAAGAGNVLGAELGAPRPVQFAARFDGADAPLDATQWYWAKLAGAVPSPTVSTRSASFPAGALPTPGGPNAAADAGLDADVDAAPFGFALLNEVNANPPGSDGGHSFIELIGEGTLPANAWLLSVDGDPGADGGTAGKINFSIPLSGRTFGANGLLLVEAASDATLPYAADPETTVVTSSLGSSSHQIGNGAESILLVVGSSPLAIKDGTTRFQTLTGLTVLDSVGWTAKGAGQVFGAVALDFPSGTPDAATRFPGATSSGAASWYWGDLAGATPASATFGANVSASFPPDGELTPGAPNVGTPRASHDAGVDAHADGPARDAHPEAAKGDAWDGSSSDDAVAASGAADDASAPDEVGDRGGCAVGGGPRPASADWALALGLLAFAGARRRIRALALGYSDGASPSRSPNHAPHRLPSPSRRHPRRGLRPLRARRPRRPG